MAEIPALFDHRHCFQHSRRPACRVFCIRLHNRQGDLVRQVPGAVDDIRALGRIIVQVQRLVMLDRRHTGEVPGTLLPADGTGDIGCRGSRHRNLSFPLPALLTGRLFEDMMSLETIRRNGT